MPILTIPIDTLTNELGYRIRPEDYYLPDPELSADERAALHVAVTAVRLEGGEAREGLSKLGGVEGTPAPALAALEVTSGLGELFDAVARRRPVEFDYRGEPRRLDPYGVVHRFGHWYVVDTTATRTRCARSASTVSTGRPAPVPRGASTPRPTSTRPARCGPTR